MAHLVGVTLTAPIDKATTTIVVTGSTVALAAAMAVPPGYWFYADIFTALDHETVLITAVVNQHVTIQRGMGGTPARDWPAGVCLCDSTAIPANSVVVPPEGGDCGDPLAGLSVCPALTFTDDMLCITPTGVVAGTYGGAVVNQYGQLVYIPVGWPASALPVWDPCCPTGGGDVVYPIPATLISYVPAPSNVCALSVNAQDAITQLDGCLAALVGVVDGGFGVVTLIAHNGIVNEGSTSGVILSLVPSGITPGIYNGFNIDIYGRVIGFIDDANQFPAPYTNTAGITFTYTVLPDPTGSYNLTIETATPALQGLVRLVNPADIMAGTIPAPSLSDAVSGDGLINAFAGPIGNITGSQGITTGAPVAPRDVRLDFPNLPIPTSAFAPTGDLLAYYDLATLTHRKVTLAQARPLFGGAVAAGRVSGAGVPIASYGVASMISPVAGTIEITLTGATESSNYVAFVSFSGGGADFYINHVSATVFQIIWITNGMGALVPDIDFAVFAT